MVGCQPWGATGRAQPGRQHSSWVSSGQDTRHLQHGNRRLGQGWCGPGPRGWEPAWHGECGRDLALPCLTGNRRQRMPTHIVSEVLRRLF